MRKRWLCAVALAVAVCAAIAFTRGVGSDYGNIDAHLRDPNFDDAQPSLDALIHGDLHGFFAQQPMMGPLTLFLRAPFAALAGLCGYDNLLVYRLGCFACLLVLAGLAVWVAELMRRAGRPLWQQLVVAAALLLNPMVFRSLAVGHPEEIVGAALCAAAGVAVALRRPALAGALLAGALTTKLWAVLIAPAFLFVFTDRRDLRRFLVVGAAITAVLYLPMLVGDSGRLWDELRAANRLGTTPGDVKPANLWWFVGHEQRAVRFATAVVNGHVVYGPPAVAFVLKPWVARVAHPVVVLLSWSLCALWALRADLRRRSETLLLLISLVFLLRCILDPGNSSYYHVAALVALAAYEGLAFRRFPWATAIFIAWLQAFTWIQADIHSDAGFGLLYLALAVPMAAALAVWLVLALTGCRRSRSTPRTPQ